MSAKNKCLENIETASQTSEDLSKTNFEQIINQLSEKTHFLESFLTKISSIKEDYNKEFCILERSIDIFNDVDKILNKKSN
ncbi:hypothetical protein PVAND_002997 [Polypedilum vanderplanki]|uniref:Uncharacterized protein n=1 Tax=Polypedilum vanderplanki TaxID=319348 RepID=A0A9J6BTK8_POLVA|nr:hypothetical protein PVAND_002997 [Polypedilum vanderplanki]